MESASRFGNLELKRCVLSKRVNYVVHLVDSAITKNYAQKLINCEMYT